MYKGQSTVDPAVDHPSHYTAHPSGVECIDITEHMGFSLGNAVKYIWRADLKGNAVQDLKKAAFYVNREIERLEKLAAAREAAAARKHNRLRFLRAGKLRRWPRGHAR